MESAAAGCATITSTKGGLPETFDNKLFINQVNESELFKMVNFLIKNKKIRLKHQQYNWKNVKHKLSDKEKKIDNLKNFYLNANFNFNKVSSLKFYTYPLSMKEMTIDYLIFL